MRNIDKDQYKVLLDLARTDPAVLATLRLLDKTEDPIPVLIDCIRTLSISSKSFQDQLIEIMSTDTRKLVINIKDWSQA